MIIKLNGMWEYQVLHQMWLTNQWLAFVIWRKC